MSSKNKTKVGMFSLSSKTSFQDTLRANKLASLKEKDVSKLTKRQKSMVSAASSFTPTTQYTKTGLSKELVSTPSLGNNSNSFNTQVFSMSDKTPLSVASLITSTSKTGVLNKQQAYAGVQTFIDKLKDTGSYTNVTPIKDSSGNITQVKLDRDYQTTTLTYNPKTLSFNKSDWKVNIPSNFIKVSENKYVSPTAEYTDRYVKKKSSGKVKDKKIETASYTPTEIYLTDSGKLSKVIEKDVYTKDYLSKETDSSRDLYKDRDVYTSKIVNFNKLGELQSLQEYTPYSKKEEETQTDKDTERKEYKKDIYLSKELSFNTKGQLQSSKKWEDYISEKNENKKNKYDTYEEEKRDIFLTEEKKYSDTGAIESYKDWDSYVEFEDFGPQKEKVKRDTFLKSEDYYDTGYKVATVTYDDYLSDVDVINKPRRVFYNESNNIEVGASEDVYRKYPKEWDKSQTTPYIIKRFNEQELEYKTGLSGITFYDPLTGKVLKEEKYQ